MTLRKLQIGDEAAFAAAIAEWEQGGEADYDFTFHFEADETYADYVEKLHAWSLGERLPERFVPHSYLVGVLDDGRIVGRVSVRHRLNDFLLQVGGHIGYMVLPQFRRQGFGTELLRESIPYARRQGVDRILVTCDDDNVGSARIIEANGGVLENIVSGGPHLNKPKRRYWIEKDPV